MGGAPPEPASEKLHRAMRAQGFMLKVACPKLGKGGGEFGRKSVRTDAGVTRGHGP